VLGRAQVPIVTDPRRGGPPARAGRTLGHGAWRGRARSGDRGRSVPAVRGLDDERARFFGDLVHNSLDEAARRALEAMMKGYEHQSDFAKKLYRQGRDDGRA
jgi:hypothetical protein